MSEQNPAEWWEALGTALAKAKASAGITGSDIAGISVAAQCHGLVPIDANGEVIRPAKLWNDTTSAVQSDRFRGALSIIDWVERVGSLPPPAFTISKLAWLAENEPENFARLARVALPHDWLTLKLSGQFVTDRSDASGTGYFSAARGRYDQGILGMIDSGRDWLPMLPAVHDPGEAAGLIRPQVAEQLGISPRAVVGAGSGDQHAGALGLGVEEGDVVFVFGTSGVVYGLSRTEVHDPRGDVNSVADAAGGFQPLVCTLNAAKVTDTIARILGVDHDELARLALAAPRDCDRPVLAPYFDGERTPDRPRARGLLGGLSTATSREQIALAAFEGVVLGLVEGHDSLERLGVKTGARVLATGGGSSSPAYLQVLADSLGRGVHTVNAPQPVARGAAIQVAAALGGVPISQVREAWMPSTRLAAEPRDKGTGIRDRYRTISAWAGLES